MTENNKFARDLDGLFDALMSELEDLRDGVSSPNEAHAFAAIAGRAIDSKAEKRTMMEFMTRKEYAERELIVREIEARRPLLLEYGDHNEDS